MHGHLVICEIYTKFYQASGNECFPHGKDFLQAQTRPVEEGLVEGWRVMVREGTMAFQLFVAFLQVKG